MGKIKVTSRMRSSNPDCEETFFRSYDGEGALCETRVLSSEEDYASGSFSRISTDNGRTWTDWVSHFNDAADGRRGKIPGSKEGDEILGGCSPYLYDPKTGCTVGVGSTFYYLKGHDVGYFAMWYEGEDNVRTHAYYAIRRPDGSEEKRMIEFEEGGEDFDPANPRNPAFIDKNRAMAGDLTVLPDGDLMFNLFPSMRLCCRIAGVDVNTFFPSCPDMQSGLVVVRLHWNPERNDYDFIYSNPIMLCDLQSSRGIMEPQMRILKNGTIMIVFRGSNTQIPVWHTRTNPSTPGFKWYVLSEDGGRTFTPPMPWYFDTKEVVYSSASTSAFYRCPKNGKLYWMGNIIPEPWRIEGNNPRWPFVICEVNEEYGFLIKDTLTVIDSLREGELTTELSNPSLLENRETGNLEIRMTKINMSWADETVQQSRGKWYSEAWEYILEFEN